MQNKGAKVGFLILDVSLDKIGSGQAMAEQMYFKLLQPYLKCHLHFTLSANIHFCINNIGLCYFIAAPEWPKSHLINGPLRALFAPFGIPKDLIKNTMLKPKYGCSLPESAAHSDLNQ